MRELKFRAWFNEKPSWCNQLFYSHEELAGLGDWFSECLIEQNDVLIEQFTGLLDSQGREIYEGDRVVVGEPVDNSVSAVVKYGTATLIAWGYDDHKEYTYYGWYLDGLIDCNGELVDGRLTIIGNIHESE